MINKWKLYHLNHKILLEIYKILILIPIIYIVQNLKANIANLVKKCRYL